MAQQGIAVVIIDAPSDRRSGLAGLRSSESAFAKGHAVPHFDLEKLQLPVLVLAQHEDGCSVTAPKDLPLVVDRLTGPSRKKAVELTGGKPTGDLCAHQGTHGFGGLDAPAVQAISDFVLQ